MARGATILAEIVGYGSSSDAHHITASHPEGLGARLAMIRALQEANIPADSLDYINAHGTSTPLGDRAELLAIDSLLSRKTLVSSTKGATGHLLSGAGAVEAAFTCLSIFSVHLLALSHLSCSRSSRLTGTLLAWTMILITKIVKHSHHQSQMNLRVHAR